MQCLHIKLTAFSAQITFFFGFIKNSRGCCAQGPAPWGQIYMYVYGLFDTSLSLEHSVMSVMGVFCEKCSENNKFLIDSPPVF